MISSFDPATLTCLLRNHLSLNLSRIKCLSAMVLSMIEGRSVNLSRLSGLIKSAATSESIYKRVQRFIKEVMFTRAELAPFLLLLMEIKNSEGLVLILDRTNWKFGKIHLNILYLAIAYQGIAIPILWTFLEDKKQGNSDHLDRIDIIESFIKIFGKDRISCVLGDREFIGKHWINWLKDEKIPHAFRLKEAGQYIANARGEFVKANRLFDFLKPNEYVNLGRRKIGKTDGYEGFVSALRNADGELVVLIHSPSIEDPCSLYRQRWQIEVLFRVLKTSGFNLEDTHITDYDRLDTVLGIVSIACCLAYRIGEMVTVHEPPVLKKHGYKPRSIIRYGLDLIQNCIRRCDAKNTLLIVDFFKRILGENSFVLSMS